jgi:hypothetical protein
MEMKPEIERISEWDPFEVVFDTFHSPFIHSEIATWNSVSRTTRYYSL